jgi:probable F420-dependent oxidoreductase
LELCGGILQFGIVFPQSEVTECGASLVAFCLAVENAGFDHLLFYDHVLGADSVSRPDWRGPYDHRDPFLEPLVTVSHIAAITQLQFLTGVLVLPQRQTVLVAKQLATLDALAPGRFRLGVGIGWNDVEYQALGVGFHSRARRLEEQIPLLRKLLSEPIVDHRGYWDIVDRAGILPLPTKPPPIWIGSGSSASALERVGRLADGWIPTPRLNPGNGFEEAWSTVLASATRSGRSRSGIGLEGHVGFSHRDLGKMGAQVKQWQQVGADAVAINILRAGATWPDGHIELVRQAAELLAHTG